MLLWEIWNKRNNWLWRSTLMPSFRCARFAFNFLQDFHNANLSAGVQVGHVGGIRQVHWQCPPPGMLKMNIEAGISVTENVVGMGMVVRDHLDSVVCCRTQNLNGSFQSNVAEALFLKEALSWVRQQGIGIVQVETDAFC